MRCTKFLKKHKFNKWEEDERGTITQLGIRKGKYIILPVSDSVFPVTIGAW